ncbi:MAG: NAD(P)H-dependent oxidoreductase [Bacteroidetes bacterium]|nr:NAD(P)H-dependent oxidoreductase [Bacteroidota bacterium]
MTLNVDKKNEPVIVFSCTNRPNSYSLKTAKLYCNILKSFNIENELFDLQNLPSNFMVSELYGNRSNDYTLLLNRFVANHTKFIFILPEYNGSYPGVMKVFIDSVHPRLWENKKACLVGVSDGRAGNLRGMDHFTSVLQYLKMHVYYNKLPISLIAKQFDTELLFIESQMKVCLQQIEGFLNF